MKYSDNITIQKFIERLVEVLKYENTYREPNGKKLYVPFLVSVLWQDVMNNYEYYNDFCSDLTDCDYYDIVIGEDDYDICKVNVFFYNETKKDDWKYVDWKCVEEADFRYEITFSYDERNLGYCECSPNNPDYREDKHCCGHECDWKAPSIEVRKSFLVSNHSWSGDEHDYWDFEDKFHADEEREYKIKNLKETIKNAQKELKKLENL